MDVLPSNSASDLQPLNPLSQDVLLQHGCPTTTHPDLLIRHGNYLISYNHTLRIPNWTIEYLTPESLVRDASCDRSFIPDVQIDKRFQVTDADYAEVHNEKHRFLERGHMAPICNHSTSVELAEATNYYTNVVPQVGPGFNSNFFAEGSGYERGKGFANYGHWTRLEIYVRQKVKHDCKAWVVSGCLFLPDPPKEEIKGKEGTRRFVTYEVIGSQNVAVPTHFFKAVLLMKAGRKVEQQEEPVTEEWFKIKNEEPEKREFDAAKYKTTAEEIEKILGYVIFPKICSTSAAGDAGKVQPTPEKADDNTSPSHDERNSQDTVAAAVKDLRLSD